MRDAGFEQAPEMRADKHRMGLWYAAVCALFMACGLSAVPAPAQAVKSVASDRKVIAGDRLRISVAEDSDLSRVYTVAGDGTIDFGFIGRVTVGENTVAAIGEMLKKTLEESYFKEASVKVEIAEYVEGAILVMGAVRVPGPIAFRGDQMITLLDAILQCGGLAGNAAGTEVRILRLVPGGGMQRQTLKVNVQDMFERLDFTGDQYLRPRDIVYVPDLGGGKEGAAEFLALGDLGSPGFHPYTPGLDIIRAIMRAGGVLRGASWESARILRPDKSGQYSIIPINLSRLFGAADMTVNIPVLAGDILFLPSAGQATRGQVYLVGEVAKPGFASLPISEDVTLAKMILGAGGFTKFANDSKVKILRKAPDGSRQTLYVDVGRILKLGLFEEDVPLEDGDVIIVSETILGF
jgi:polysaccharide biosynthesis/export protein